MKLFFQYRENGTVVSYSDKPIKPQVLREVAVVVTDEQKQLISQNPIMSIIGGELVIENDSVKQIKSDFVKRVKDGTVDIDDVVTLLEKVIV